MTPQNSLSRVSTLRPDWSQEAGTSSDRQQLQDCNDTSGVPKGPKVQSRAATENPCRPPQVPTPTISSKFAETGDSQDTKLEAPTSQSIVPVSSFHSGSHDNAVSSLGPVASAIGQGQLPSTPHSSLRHTLTSTQSQSTTTASPVGRVGGSEIQRLSVSSMPPIEPTRVPIPSST